MNYLSKIKYMAMLTGLMTLIAFGCGDDDELSLDEQIIDQLLTDSLLNVVEDFDIEINRGTNPPDLQNTYFASPQILEDSNIPGDNIGRSFTDLTLQIVDQNNDDLTVAVFTREGSSSSSSGVGGFIIGEDDRFTLFVQALSIRANNLDSAQVLSVYSGVLTADGIRDLNRLIILTEDFGDPNGRFIEIGESRLIVDPDGFSPVIDVDISNGRSSSQSTSNYQGTPADEQIE
ncbi:MAG: hypothetical protein AAFN93_13560 [Bacteroidota bacterium]